ncbi:MAG: gliding motility-associated C-terminal domain-containing protein [Bacteroidales bacterium]|nr:gliding motility-associated C-terminal domain-containing protein [Bacteroidales bacterium]
MTFKVQCRFLLVVAALLVMTLFLPLCANATHNRAGEITYKQISALTFEVTVITYTAITTDACPAWTADRPELDIEWGDNTVSTLIRSEKINLPDCYRRNKYVGQHTYAGPGIFRITVEDPNRNANVANIPNSVNTLFAISTTMIIDPTLGLNNTPILTQPPVDKAAVGQVFVHNPGAYDPDGDSLSYKITPCREENGAPIPNYSYPPASNFIRVDAITGDLIWNTPMMVGIYNVAMLIEEWREGVKIGEIIRDMQIEVFDSGNTTPQIDLTALDTTYGSHDSICIEAGTWLKFDVEATDANNDNITLSAYGAPFVASSNAPAHFEQTESQAGYAKGRFDWVTSCNVVRKQPYILNIKAQDDNPIVNLVDLKSIYITIVGPAVQNLHAVPSANFITLSWSQSVCENVVGYNIYRKIQPSGFVHDFCQTGVPSSTGYEKVGHVAGRENLLYVDRDIAQGHEYCYMVCAVFPDGAEGYASDEVCTSLPMGLPTMTNVSVLSTSRATGSIYVAWVKPDDAELAASSAPYKYVIFRSRGFLGDNFTRVGEVEGLDNTEFTDNNVNTVDYPYTYKIEFYGTDNGESVLIGSPSFASSVFIDLTQQENSVKVRLRNNVPWTNYNYEYYRYDSLTDTYNVIGSTTDKSIIDSNVENGHEYCYYVKSYGRYSLPGFPEPLENLSQQVCKLSVDTVAPCRPEITVTSICDSAYNLIQWSVPDSCNYDVDSYTLYYTPVLDGEYQVLSTFASDVTEFRHYPNDRMAGCYYISASDPNGNVSENSMVSCVDECSYYDLPNVFTPNGDGINDYYHPIGEYKFVEKVDMTILNRWGEVMFETTDPDIMWDGRNKMTGTYVVPGVYFYICEVYEQRLTGLEARHLKGFIHVFRAEEVNQNHD